MFITVLYMFRATSCSLGDQILLIKNLVWSLSVSGCPVHRKPLTDSEDIRFSINTI